MKKNQKNVKRNRPLPYPGAAEPGYFLNKVIDGCLAIVTGAGACAILFVLAFL